MAGRKKFFYIHKCITSILASLRFWLQATVTNQTPLGVPAACQCMKRPKTTLGVPPVSLHGSIAFDKFLIGNMRCKARKYTFLKR
jgi:hypothetical protein